MKNPLQTADIISVNFFFASQKLFILFTQKLAELLYEAAELDELLRAEFIEDVLGVTKEDLTAGDRS